MIKARKHLMCIVIALRYLPELMQYNMMESSETTKSHSPAICNFSDSFNEIRNFTPIKRVYY